MTASEYIKAQGLPNLQYVADKVGKHRDTINNWYHAEYALFEVVVAGVVWFNLSDVKMYRPSVGLMLEKMREDERITTKLRNPHYKLRTVGEKIE